jgi:hypothetical protein
VETLIKIPSHYEAWGRIGEGVSNSSSPPNIAEGANKALKTSSVFVFHAAWDHCGFIFCLDDGLFYEEVHVYKEHVETMSADSLDNLIRVVNDKYGWE